MEYKKYEIWHDESKEGGYYHGILFVPVDKRNRIIELLKLIRDKYGYSHDANIKFAGCLGKTKLGRFISNNLSLFSHIIKTSIKTRTGICCADGKEKYFKNYSNFLNINEFFGCYFGLLKIEDNLASLQCDTYAKKIELTFNFILKGCGHGMFKDNPIEIVKFYFDGYEHHLGGIDLNNIARGKFREYCKIADNIGIDSKKVSERKDDTRLMINFIDYIIGAWRSLLNKERDNNNVLSPISGLHDRLMENKIFSNKNSEWYRSISLSELCVDDDKIRFPNIFRNSNQGKLF